MQQQSSMQPGQGGDDDDEDEDDYWDDDGFEGTPLEEYSTPLDYDNGEDEYRFFTAALLRKSSVLINVYLFTFHTHLNNSLITEWFIFSLALLVCIRGPEQRHSLVPVFDGSAQRRPEETAAGDLQHLTAEEEHRRQGPMVRRQHIVRGGGG